MSRLHATEYTLIGGGTHSRCGRFLLLLLAAVAALATLSIRPTATLAASRSPQYARAQLHGFEIFTLPGNTHDGCTRDAQFDEANKLCYLGLDDVALDAERRTALMIRAVEAAHASAATNRSADVLHVFLAPEFFFRGPAGAYRTDDILASGDDNFVNRLFRHVNSERFSNWLFVFGTVVAGSPPNTSFSPRRYAADAWAWYNFAPVVRGGRNAQGWLVFKNYVSTIDFLRFGPAAARRRDEQAEAGEQIGTVPDPRRHQTKHYSAVPAAVRDLIAQANRAAGYTRWTMLGDHEMLIETGGLRVGVEICVDHLSGPGNRGLRGQLEREGVASGLRAGEYHPLDLQLVVSAGMSLAFGPILTLPGAPAFLVDGYSRTELAINPYGRGDQTLNAAANASVRLGDDAWLDALGPGIGAYNMGPVAFHDSEQLLHSAAQAVFSMALKEDYEDAFASPPGWREEYARAISVAPVVDFANATDLERFGELFLVSPYRANRRVFRALVEGLAHKLNKPVAELYDVVARRIGTRLGDFGPAVATFPPVSLM